MADDVERLLALLPPIAPDIEREARVQQRCHAAMARRLSRRAAARSQSRAGLLDIAAAAALCVYLAATLMAAARLGWSL
jgi:hypothetical protein